MRSEQDRKDDLFRALDYHRTSHGKPPLTPSEREAAWKEYDEGYQKMLEDKLSIPEDSMSMPVEDCRRWFKANVKPGSVVFIKHTHAGFTCYCADIMVEIVGRGKFKTEKHGCFYSSGKFTQAPTGQTNMVIPTVPILEAAIAGRLWHFWGHEDQGINMRHPYCGVRPSPVVLGKVIELLGEMKRG